MLLIAAVLSASAVSTFGTILHTPAEREAIETASSNTVVNGFVLKNNRVVEVWVNGSAGRVKPGSKLEDIARAPATVHKDENGLKEQPLEKSTHLTKHDTAKQNRK